MEGHAAMTGQRGFDPGLVGHYIEIRDIHDGWSVAVMEDGRILNRWPPGDRRYGPTQDWIRKVIAVGSGRLSDGGSV
jgi:hypothetical protein